LLPGEEVTLHGERYTVEEVKLALPTIRCALFAGDAEGTCRVLSASGSLGCRQEGVHPRDGNKKLKGFHGNRGVGIL
jgi:hypothetical protein